MPRLISIRQTEHHFTIGRCRAPVCEKNGVFFWGCRRCGLKLRPTPCLHLEAVGEFDLSFSNPAAGDLNWHWIKSTWSVIYPSTLEVCSPSWSHFMWLCYSIGVGKAVRDYGFRFRVDTILDWRYKRSVTQCLYLVFFGNNRNIFSLGPSSILNPQSLTLNPQS